MKKSSIGCGCLLTLIIGFVSLAAIGSRNAKRDKLEADNKTLVELTTKSAEVAEQNAKSVTKALDSIGSTLAQTEKHFAKLREEGMDAIKTGIKYQHEAEMKLEDLLSEPNLTGFPKNREQLRPIANGIAARSPSQLHISAWLQPNMRQQRH